MLKKIIIMVFILVTVGFVTAQSDKNVIYLSWDKVVDISLNDNLTLKSKLLDYEAQNKEEWKAYTSFLPTVTYQATAVKNVELPVFVFMGQQISVGSKYSFQHSLDLTLPVFTGGMRWFNLAAQKNLRKSLSEELKGQEAKTVLGALQSYYGIMLAEELSQTAEEAVKVSKENLDQVEKFYNAGTATELDLQRARAQYYSTLPQMQSASSGRYLAYQRLKTILNISLDDSLSITDSLGSRNFLNEYTTYSLAELKNLAQEGRNDLKSLEFQREATNESSKMSLAQFAPTIAVSANLTQQAQTETSKLMWNDYIRSKSIALSVSWPLFEGGKRILDYQIAEIRNDQMELALSQAKDGASLDVEEKFYNYQNAEKSLNSLQQTMQQSKESLRISTLMYHNGLSTQLDVLNSQLLYTNSKAEYLRGIYNYNISQLELLQSVGLMDKVWK